MINVYGIYNIYKCYLERKWIIRKNVFLNQKHQKKHLSKQNLWFEIEKMVFCFFHGCFFKILFGKMVFCFFLVSGLDFPGRISAGTKLTCNSFLIQCKLAFILINVHFSLFFSMVLVLCIILL